jgi:hypothetical protein
MLQEQRQEQQVEEWSAELNWIYANDNPTCRRAQQLEALLDAYWDSKPDWEEEELLELQLMSA